MNCCDKYGDCRQGRDCPVRKPEPCKWCEGLGYDKSGYKCVCQPDHFGDQLAMILLGVIALLVSLMTAISFL